MEPPIYLDHHATTPADPRVIEAMLPWFGTHFANPASFHAAGKTAEAAVGAAREHVAALIHADPKGIVFTSGATESNHLLLHGLANFHRAQGRTLRVISAVTEHPAILAPLEQLEAAGHPVTRLPVDSLGHIDLAQLADTLADTSTTQPTLVTLMAANNEIGTLADLPAIGALTRAAGATFHCDASQAAGLLPIDVDAANIDALSFTAHKLYGPKGTGALFLRRRRPRLRITSPFAGGGQENGLRPGTLNVPAIVGFGRACELAAAEMSTRREHFRTLRDQLLDELTVALDGLARVERNGDPNPDHLHPGNLNVVVHGIPSRWIRGHLSWLACSSGSACASALQEPSHVLRTIGRSTEVARQSLRFGIGKDNTSEEITRAVAAIRETVAAFDPNVTYPSIDAAV